ncbi:hypothetical protein [Xanthomonas sp. XNM01]|uniref:hypothetical protein n=1 Tax=Xanthomonas sp. XNM01 TaxID=2769289 RepID=UPI00177D5847|nr:hypothetical protein [Xanthomonas sp. XNM01]MBD9368742.1 hypothetical protein [Xanthomonas sp. XNM01]
MARHAPPPPPRDPPDDRKRLVVAPMRRPARIDAGAAPRVESRVPHRVIEARIGCMDRRPREASHDEQQTRIAPRIPSA